MQFLGRRPHLCGLVRWAPPVHILIFCKAAHESHDISDEGPPRFYVGRVDAMLLLTLSNGGESCCPERFEDYIHHALQVVVCCAPQPLICYKVFAKDQRSMGIKLSWSVLTAADDLLQNDHLKMGKAIGPQEFATAGGAHQCKCGPLFAIPPIPGVVPQQGGLFMDVSVW